MTKRKYKQSSKQKRKKKYKQPNKSNKKKPYFDWFNVIIGIIALYFGVTYETTSVDLKTLTSIEIELSSEITRGRKNETIDYIFTTDSYPASFFIRKGSLKGGAREAVSRLIKGQKITINTQSYRPAFLLNKDNKLPIYGLTINNKTILTPTDFNNNQWKYSARVQALILIAGGMMLLNGITEISSKTNNILIAFFIGAAIFMKIFGFGLY